jgi:hypothetical protein
LSGTLTLANEGIIDPATVTLLSPDLGPGPVKRIDNTNLRYTRILLVEKLRAGLKITKSPTEVEVKFNSSTIFTLQRPTSHKILHDQVPFVLAAADLRAERVTEIVLQQDDVLSFLGGTVRMHDVSHGWTLEVLRSVKDACTVIHSQVKHEMTTPRPVQVCPETAPMIQTPQHSSLPSGHSVEVSAMAYVLSRLSGKTDHETIHTDNYLMRTAARVALNRHVAGVHFPFESMAGFLLGITVGQIFWRRLAGENTVANGGGITAHHFTVTPDKMNTVDFTLGKFAEAREAVIADDLPGWLDGTTSMDVLPGSTPSELKFAHRKALEEWE